jgi:transcriptional regulator with XRE-family HTH domain
MSKKQPGIVTSGDGRWLGEAREAAGLSPRALARRTGIAKRRLLAIERGDVTPTPEERELLVTGCGLTGVPTPDEHTRAVLHEYVSMVAELRNTTPEQFGPVRQEDVAVLATALGDPPELVEARIAQILATGATGAGVRAAGDTSTGKTGTGDTT